jgi:hypothetical protein
MKLAWDPQQYDSSRSRAPVWGSVEWANLFPDLSFPPDSSFLIPVVKP